MTDMNTIKTYVTSSANTLPIANQNVFPRSTYSVKIMQEARKAFHADVHM